MRKAIVLFMMLSFSVSIVSCSSGFNNTFTSNSYTINYPDDAKAIELDSTRSNIVSEKYDVLIEADRVGYYSLGDTESIRKSIQPNIDDGEIKIVEDVKVASGHKALLIEGDMSGKTALALHVPMDGWGIMILGT